MPPRRKFDKKTATTFTLVHRAQNDPLINDENAPSMVFTEKVSRHRGQDDDSDLPSSSGASMVSGTSGVSRRGKQRGDLEEEFGMSFRPNEGEAAQHGVFYDDTQYDYMQHMKDLGSGDGPVAWIEAQPAKQQKGKQKLEDALRDMDIGSNAGGRFDDAQSVGQSSMASSAARSLLPEDVLPSEFVRRRTYQDQQDIPDAIAGFQPDMDPRLRETLEALNDDAYVDDEDDFFGDLVKEGREIEQDEWERLGEQQMFEAGEGELDDGWESDDTIRAASPPPKLNVPQPADGELIAPPSDTQAALPADPTEGAWLDEFKKFKHEAKANKEAGKEAKAAPSAFDASMVSSLASRPGKKRKGAKTSTSNYSMSSSALVRTDQQNLLDDRFDKLEEAYTIAEEMEDDEMGPMNDTMSTASGMTGMSKASRMSKYSQMSGMSGVSGISSYSRATDSEAPQLQRSDFDSIMDDFLGNHSVSGKASRKLKRFGPQTGMEQLDEVRSGLGPARRKGRSAIGAAR
ncbi:hypothetical protein WHR41_08776 [Cladosporium halotolerans]|uniref:Low temperature viability protein n=1 Tax=Cladosporium halotolerans TaxID=1052096 RepID=A0AB34KCR7_9PEZI